MIRINLLTPDLIKKEEREEIVLFAQAFLALVILVAVVSLVFKFGAYRKVASRLGQLEQELSKYESIVKQVDALKATKAVLETKKNVINSLMVSRIVYPQFMESMLDVLPRTMWFRNIVTKLQPDNTMTISLSGEAFDNYAVADFISALIASADYRGVELGPVTTNANNADKSQTSVFGITFNYKKELK